MFFAFPLKTVDLEDSATIAFDSAHRVEYNGIRINDFCLCLDIVLSIILYSSRIMYLYWLNSRTSCFSPFR